jgi:signal transduction histidine kinase
MPPNIGYNLRAVILRVLNLKKLLDCSLFFFRRIALSIQQRVNEFGAQYLVFGIFGIINYPLVYFIWRDPIPQIYNPFNLRVIAALLCVPLVFNKRWPAKLRKFLPLYWYLTLLYCLPFFGTYMLLKNQVSMVWLMNDVLALFLLILLVDWLSFVVLISLGIILGCFFFWITGGAINYQIDKSAIILALYMYPFAIIIGAIFSRNKERLTKERLQTIKTIGTSIAHELRTPLRTISLSASNIKDTFTVAEKHKLPLPLSPHNYETILRQCNIIELETQESFTVINMLLMNVNQSINTKEFKTCSINHCIDEAVQRYPFDLEEDERVHWKRRPEDNFLFKGNELLAIHVLY